jgi:N-acetylglucosamine repressor
MASSYAVSNHPAVRQSNRAAIFRAIYDSAPIARVDLAVRTGLNARTVSRIVDELITHGLARELGYREVARVGRRAVELEVDLTSRYAVGVDIAHSHVTAALVDLAGRIHKRLEGPEAAPPFPIGRTIPAAAKAVKRLLATLTAQERAKTVGIGIGAPSRFKVDNGTWYGLSRAGDSPGWVDLGSADFERETGLPVVVDNNANTSALAELWFGNGKGVPAFVLMNLYAGIGMGIVIDGEVYRGGNQLSGEAGHLTIDINGRQCGCGNFGCLGKYLSRSGLRESLRSHLNGGESSTLQDGPGLSLPDVIAASDAGDDVASALRADVIRYLTGAFVSLMSTYDPQMILLGRDLAAAGDRFFDDLRTCVLDRLHPAIRDNVRIEPADVKDAPLIGAATLALREFFRAPLGSRGSETSRPNSARREIPVHAKKVRHG